MEKSVDIITSNDIEGHNLYKFSISSGFEQDILPYQKGLKAFLVLLSLSSIFRNRLKNHHYEHDETANEIESLRDEFYEALGEHDINLDADIS